MIRPIVLVALVVFAGAMAQAEAPAPAAQASILSGVADDAVFAVRVRAPQLAATPLWKKATAADASGYRRFMAHNPLRLDPEKDAADMVFALSFQYVNGEPKPSGGAVILLVRDVDLKTVFKKKLRETTVKGVPGPVYALAKDLVLAFPNPRTLVVGSRDYLVKVAEAGAAVRQALQESLQKMRASLPEKSRRHAAASRFVRADFMLRLVLELQTGMGAMDLSRPADAAQFSMSMGTENAAAFCGSGLALLEPSLTALLASAGPEVPAPPQEPVYRATFQGKEVRVVMSRAMLDWLAMAGEPPDVRAEMRGKAAASLKNLSQIGKAWRQFAAGKKGESAKSLADLAPNLGKQAVLLNPVLREHAAGGDYELIPLPNAKGIPYPPATIVAHERYPEPALAPAAGIGVVFADGHTERMAA
ncbi:MAG: hypothetical protein NTU94_15850, partial [Planctomycetota bacterium]|nr:hypothetical protein [Planctomycetota bacterium]